MTGAGIPRISRTRADRFGVFQRAKIEHLRQRRAGQYQAPRRCSGGDEQALVVNVGARAGVDEFAHRIDGRNRRAEKQFHRQFAVSVLAEHLLRRRQLIGRDRDLRQRWPVVGEMRFGAEQDNASLGALGAQGFCRRGAGQPAADDDEVKVLGHISVPVISSAAPAGAASSMRVIRRSRSW